MCGLEEKDDGRKEGRKCEWDEKESLPEMETQELNVGVDYRKDDNLGEERGEGGC